MMPMIEAILSPARVRELTGNVKANVTAGPAHDIGRWIEDQRLKIVGRVNVFQVEVTPAVAVAWLKFNEKNRNPSRPKIRRFAAAMKEGKWRLNGECLKFSGTGRLLDGQSRLMAIVEAGVAVTLEVRGGISDQAQECMDTGEARMHRHQLEMLGEKNPNECAAALRLLYFWEQSGIASGGEGGNRSAAITNTTIREMLEKHPAIRESVGRTLNLKALLPVSAAAFFHYLFSRADEKKAGAFIDRLTTGANLSASSPVYQLRERLSADRIAPSKLKKRDKFAMVIKSWNAFRQGKTITRLVFNPAEDFPEISGLPAKGGAS